MNALFLGDSITEGFDLAHYFPEMHFVNHGISGYSSEELLKAMHKGWFSHQPEVVFLCIGTNDLAREYDKSSTLDNIRSMVKITRDYAPEKVRIFLCSLFPTRHNPPRPNPVINELNTALQLLALDLKAEYLHLNPFFKDSNGQLRLEFTDDGLHLNAKSYAQWATLIRCLLGNFSHEETFQQKVP